VIGDSSEKIASTYEKIADLLVQESKLLGKVLE
jgi:hypothetical protein